MIILDGRRGEGGGQILRSSLAMSALTGQAFRLSNIRGNRPKPGLKRQHLCAVHAAARIANAHVEGAELNSREIIFTPQHISGGEYHFKIGSGGSAMLVLQTILPMLLKADGSSEVHIEGATHNPFSPSFDFIQHNFIPQLHKIGADIKLEMKRPGFMTAGGGEIVAKIQPLESAQPLQLLERGEERSRSAFIHIAHLPNDIVEREVERLVKKLSLRRKHIHVIQHDSSIGPGNAVDMRLDFEEVCDVNVAYGIQGLSAERVVGKVCRQVKNYLTHNYPVSEYLADQLMLPLSITAGGGFQTGALSSHSLTNIETIAEFVGFKNIHFDEKNRQVKVNHVKL